MIGEIYDVIYGLDEGNRLEIISEPFQKGHGGTKYVKVKDSNGDKYDIELEKLQGDIYYRKRKTRKKK